jgi:hypothetical protein
MMKKFFLGSIFLMLALFCGHALLAQQTSGNIIGSVKDATGAVVPNAAITATNEATGIKATATSNGSGEFNIVNLLPGSYDMSVVAPGFQPYTIKGLSVQTSHSSTVDVPLSVGATSTVEVQAGSGTTLDTTTTNLTTSFSPQELSVLPTATIGLGVLNESLLAPNVASSGGIGIGTGPSIAGQRPRNNNYTVEGIDNNDKSVTGPLVYVPNDAVSDFTLITTQFSPEFGHSTGGQFNTNVLSGTNHVHGKLYEYFDNRNLNAESGIQGGKIANPRYDFNRYGGQLGGPIKRDKIFAFASFERQTTGQNESYYLCTPTTAGLSTLNGLGYGFSATNLAQYMKYTPAATAFGGAQVTDANDNACFNQKSGAQYLTVYQGIAQTSPNVFESGASTNIPLGNYLVAAPVFSNFDALTTSGDYTISSKDSLRLRYLYNTEGAEDTAAALPQFFTTLPFRYHLIAISEYHSFTSNLTNEFRLGYNRYSNAYTVGPQTYPGLDSFPNLYIDDQNALDYGPDDNAPQSGIQNLYQVTNNVHYTKGNHTFTIGFDGRKFIAPQTFTQRVRGDYEWDYLSEFLHDLAPTSFGQRSTGNFIYYGDQSALYGYANDTWRVTPELTVNYGIRYEFTSVPVGERAQQLNAAASVPGLITFNAPQPAYKNFAPRFGINYAPDAKTSIRAGFGLGYDVIFDNLGLLSFPPQYSSTNSVGDGNINYTGKMNPNPGDQNFLANGGLPAGNGGLATFSSVAKQRAATAAYVPNQVTPYAENWNLQIQRTLPFSTVASVTYVGTRGVHLETQVQINKQPEVTLANQLTTYYGVAASGPSTVSTAANVNTLSKITTGNSSVVPAYLAAGFTGSITSYQPYSESNYNGLSVNLSRRFINGLQFDGSYTWSKTMDDATAEVFATVLTPRRPQNSQCIACDYSRSSLDRTNRLTLEMVYDLPYFKHSNFLLKNTLGNWEVSPIYTYESPEYATVLNGINATITGDSGSAIERPLVNPNGVKGTSTVSNAVYSNNPALSSQCSATAATVNGVPTCSANLVGYAPANPNAYYIQAGIGTLPNAARNTLPVRPIDNLDVTALKRIAFTERYSFEFSAQAFNVLNHAQYIPGSVDTIDSKGYTSSYAFQTVGNAAFNNPGKEFLNNARTMQLSAKLNF